MRVEALKAQVLQLPPEQRAELAAELLRSLDTPEAANNEQLWLQEAERRYQAYRKGQTQGVPADQALREARAKLQ